MSLYTITGAQLAFGHVALLDHADFSLEAGERVGLIGRNGAGKSSLLTIVADLAKPDDGLVTRQQNVTVLAVCSLRVAKSVQSDSVRSIRRCTVFNGGIAEKFLLAQDLGVGELRAALGDGRIAFVNFEEPEQLGGIDDREEVVDLEGEVIGEAVDVVATALVEQ